MTRPTWLGLAVAALLATLARAAPAAELVRTLANPAARPSEFGWALGASADRAIVGAPFESNGVGAAYLFDVASGALTRTFASPLGPEQYFGIGVALDGTRALVAARFAGLGADPGASYPYGAVFVYDADGGTLERVLEPPVDGVLGGPVVADGGRVAVAGALTTAAGFAEAVYVFDVASGTLAHVLVNPAGFISSFGTSVAMRGDRLLVGAFGAAYLFDPGDGSLLHAFSHPTASGFGAQVELDDHAAYVGSTSGTPDPIIDVFDAASGALLRTLTGPPGSHFPFPDGLALLPGGVLAMAADSAVVLMTATGTAFATLDLPRGCCALMPLAAAGDRLLVPVTGGGLPFDDPLRNGVVQVYDPTGCGDGVVQAPEVCDDGNLVNGDGCDANCRPDACGNGIVAGAEECDDGNALDGDDCLPDCTRPRLGVTHVTIPWYSPRTGERVVESEVWYPTGSGGPAGPWDATFGAVRDAAPAGGPLPLVVFSHGLQITEGEGIILIYRQTLRRLALAGFVVAGIDHPKDTFEFFAGNLVDRPLDVRRVLDTLLDPSRVPAVLQGLVDPDRMGVAGQSFGGYTAFAAAANSEFGTRDPRVKAIAGIAPAILLTPAEVATIGAPALIVSGELDTVTPPAAFHEPAYQALVSPKYFVDYVDGDHFAFSDACEPFYCRDRQTDRYLAAFFRTYLADDPGGEALLAPGAEAIFDNIRFRSERGPALLPGARVADRDCAVELATALPDTPGATAPAELACVDGTACDADPLPGRCGFDVRLCVNTVDRHVLACEATDVASIRVRGQRRYPELVALATAADAIVPTSDHVCTMPARVTVTLPAARPRARLVLHTEGRRADGLRDFDRFVLTCIAP